MNRGPAAVVPLGGPAGPDFSLETLNAAPTSELIRFQSALPNCPGLRAPLRRMVLLTPFEGTEAQEARGGRVEWECELFLSR